jgi:hypothetical protein
MFQRTGNREHFHGLDLAKEREKKPVIVSAACKHGADCNFGVLVLSISAVTEVGAVRPEP